MPGAAGKTARIDERTRRIKALAAVTDTACRRKTMPAAGPITALAVEAFAPEMAPFSRGRGLAARPGLVPRRTSSGGTARLGRVSGSGEADIRRLIIGATARLTRLGRRSIPEGSWLARMLARKPRMLVAIAAANGMAHAIRAMVTMEQDHRDPARAAAA